LNTEPIAYGHARLADYALDPDVIHANHGSFGAVPNVVAEAQAAWRRELEANPTRFFRTRYSTLIRETAACVAAFLGGEARDWVFVDNATSGVSIVAASWDLQPGDEVVTTDQAYGAVRKALLHYTRLRGAKLVEVPVPIPVAGEADILDAVAGAITPQTKVAVIDHVASQSALVFPVAKLAGLFRSKGIPVLVDGAHAPGMLDLDVPALGVDWYTGNGHKWLGAPRGCAFLWCRRDHQAALHPLVISHGYGAGFTAAFDWAGTRDPSPWLSAAAAIDHHLAMGGAAVRQRNRALALAAGQELVARFGTETAGPPDLTGSMVSIRLPGDRAVGPDDGPWIERRLLRRPDVEMVVAAMSGRAWVRLSAAIYTEVDDLITAGLAAAEVMEVDNSA